MGNGMSNVMTTMRTDRSPEMQAVIDQVEVKLIEERLAQWITVETAGGRSPDPKEIARKRKELANNPVRGSIAWLARQLHLKKQAVSRWDTVPVERVPMVSAVTGLPRHKIRPDKPDIYPAPIEERGRKGK